MNSVFIYSMAVFYVIAGVNHFVMPSFYLGLIPDYLPYHQLINVSSGAIEILLGAGVAHPITRKIAAIGIILLMIAFIPSHVFFIQIGSCVEGALCVPSWLSWLRLLLIHPLLMLWAYWVGYQTN